MTTSVRSHLASPHEDVEQTVHRRQHSLLAAFDGQAVKLMRAHWRVLSGLEVTDVVMHPGAFKSKVSSFNAPFWSSVSNKVWESQTFRTMLYYIDKKTFVVDFGTWIGPTLLYAARLCREILGIEGDPVAYAEVTFNLKLNSELPPFDSTCIVPGLVVSDPAASGKMVEMHSASAGNSMSGVGIVMGGAQIRWRVRGRLLQEYVKAYLPSYRVGDHLFVKMDVESYECELFPSFAKWLRSFPESAKPTFWLSMHSQIASCSAQQYKAIFDIARTYKFVSAGFVRGDTVATTGEFILSDVKPAL